MPRISLPPGCYGLRMKNGPKTRNVKPGTSVVVSDDMARAIKKSNNGLLGIISGTQNLSLGTKAGRWCKECRFLAQAWSTNCPRCGRETEPETEN